MNVFIARIRIPLLGLGFALLIASTFLPISGLIGAGLILVGLICYFAIGRVKTGPTQVRMPVTGRWFALNSPGSRIPSHGLHAWGQTYAIDLVHEPTDRPKPKFGDGKGFRRPEEFPGFGQPVLAPAAGVIVGVHNRARDHRSRTSWTAFAYLLIEGSIRELLGPGRLLGNYVIIDTGEGIYAIAAHLRRRSVTVKVGETVTTGQQIGECGNSGNSSEPHVHLQLMDHRRLTIAAGLPMAFDGFDVDGKRRRGIPCNRERFTVPER